MFHGSRDFIAKGTFTINNNTQSRKGQGIDALRKASLPQAIHDSSARDPPRCFPGTREVHIRNIIGWGSGSWEARQTRVLWLQGPAGVGKSALAQTCAEEMGDGLGAAFFFSRPNQWNKSTKFLPTIIYQLAVKYPAYGDLVDAKILRDPLLLEKSIEVQFRELLVRPLRELSGQDRGICENTVIIIDGLDECDDQNAQRVIIEVILTSVYQQTTPFLWAFFSRPEPHITASFSSERASAVCWQLTLPVSRDADKDIESYLRDGFRMIRAKYNFPAVVVWPSDRDIQQLVDQAAGLFVYIASVVRYIDQSPGVLGPEAKLRLVLELGKTANGVSSDKAPLSTLDRFYILIMKQIPKDILPSTLLLLFASLHNVTIWSQILLLDCSILGFSLTTFYAAINSLHSVLRVELSDGLPNELSFYHASFSDFLTDVGRSTSEFCVNTASNRNRFYALCVDALCRISDTHGDESASVLAWNSSRVTNKEVYIVALRYLFSLSGSPLIRIEADVVQRLSLINWALAIKWYKGWVLPMDWVEAFFDKIPENRRPKIIRLFRRNSLRRVISVMKRDKGVEESKKRFTIGSGRNKALFVDSELVDGHYKFSAP